MANITQAEKLEALVRKAKIALSVPFAQAGFESMQAVTVANAIEEYCKFLIAEKLVAIVLFNHDFARALFGKERVVGSGTLESWAMWEYYLQQAVINTDPVNYMYNVVSPEK